MARGRTGSGKSNSESNRRNDVKSNRREKNNRRADLFGRIVPKASPPASKVKTRTKKTRRQKLQESKNAADLPGLSDRVVEEVRPMRIGLGPFTYLNPAGTEGEQKELSSEDESLAGSDSEGSRKDSNGSGDSRNDVDKGNSVESAKADGFAEADDYISLSDSDSESDSTEYNASFVNAPWLSKSEPGNETGLNPVNDELLNYVRYFSAQPTEAAHREATIDRLRKIVQQIWKSAQLGVFGSHATGMYVPDADIDVSILSNEMKAKVRPEMYRIASKLRNSGIGDDVRVISHARVPIIKYVDARSHIDVDIAFGQTSGLETARLVSSWLREYPVLKPMGMFVRMFLKHRRLGDVALGGLGGYAVICMLYSRLRYVIEEFPSVFQASDDQKGRHKALLANGGLLLIDFFDFYGNVFDNNLLAVRCVEPFKPIPKRSNGNMSTPQAAGLAVEDPQDKENNISKASYNYPSVKRSFQNAANLTKAALLKWNKAKPSGTGHQKYQSFLGALLKINRGDKPREKVTLEAALKIPSIDAQEELTQSSLSPPEGGGKLQERSRKRRAHTPDNTLSKSQRISDVSPGSKRSTTKTLSTDKNVSNVTQKFDPIRGTNTQKPVSDDAEVSPSSSSKPNPESDADDEGDSRVRLTTSERRNFWKQKAGVPTPLKENEVER